MTSRSSFPGQNSRFAGVLLCLCWANLSYSDDQRNADIDHPAIIVVAGEMDDQIEFFSYGEVVAANQKVNLVIRVENTTNEPIHIKFVNRSCGCIKVDLPENSIEAGKAVTMGISIGIEPTIQELKQRVFVRLETEGARKGISMQIDFTLANHISFLYERFHLTCADRSGDNEIKIPILVSKEVKLKDYDIELSDELRVIQGCKLVREGDKTFVVGSYATTSVGSSISGDLKLVRKRPTQGQERIASTCHLEVAKSKWFEVLPSTLAFRQLPVPIDLLDQAVAIVRIRTETKELGELKSLTCETSKGVKLPCTFTKVRDGFYRITISTVENEDLVGRDQLKVTGTTPYGTAVVMVEGVLSN